MKERALSVRDYELQERFLSMWNRIGAKGDPYPAFKKLLVYYSSPNRYYHTPEHILECLKELDSVCHLCDFPEEVEVALFHHDAEYDTSPEAVYSTTGKSNEERSADLAYAFCLDSCLPDDFADSVWDLIILTKHNEMPESSDGKYMVDIDLAIFGKDQEEFDEYEKNIRKEYWWVDPKDFAKNRSNILNGFLKKERIYYTDTFDNAYGNKAIENLERAIKKLQSSLL